MRKPDFPLDEAQRLQTLCDLQVLDTPAEERFDRLTRIATAVFKAPIALVSLVDSDRQWFKSCQGLDASETPRDISFCGHAILSDEVFYIPNALLDERFADNPLVTGAPNIRFYAGAPLSMVSGHSVGTLCVIDNKPHQHTPEELQVLRDLADCVEQELQQQCFRDAVQTLGDHSSYLSAVLETVIDGIITIDELGTIQTVNPAAEELFGYSADEMQGRNVNMLMPEPYASGHDGYLRNYMKSGHAKIIGSGREVEGRRKDGSTFPMELAVTEMSQHGSRNFVGIVRDISERKEAERKLQSSSQLRQAILDSANYTIISTDTEGVVQTFNKGAEQMLGYSESEVVGKETPAIFHEPAEVVSRAKALCQELDKDIQPGFDVFVSRARLGLADEQEWTYIRKDGSRFPVMLSVTALHDSKGEITGFLGVGCDITDRKKVERMKSEFVSTVSHELRTPLTSIRGALGLVLGKLSDQLPAKALTLLETANRNSERLTLLINDILDLEKIESGRLEFEYQSLDLVEVARHALAANEGYGQQHDVTLRLTEHPDSARIWGDEHRLMQVFANLLSNAVKYSPKGGEVEVSIRRIGGNFHLGVRDHGRGIPEAFRERIFQRFAQADSSDTREKGGTGLGLSITRAIVEHHHGSIDYETEEGVGTEFFFELPVYREVIESHTDDADCPRVLICEDNPDVAFVLSQLLEQEGMVSDLAATVDAARALLANKSYCTLMLDLNLPDGDGLTFISELREEDATRDLPVIVVSGRAEEGRSTWVGDAVTVVDWLQKPVDRERLSRALGQALHNGKLPRILHVEDEHDIIQVTQALIEEVGEYCYATTLKEARHKLNSEQFNLVILDMTLPDGSGLELLDEMKGDCKVLVFSGQEPDKELSKQVSAALTKSRTSNDRLLNTIKQIVNKV